MIIINFNNHFLEKSTKQKFLELSNLPIWRNSSFLRWNWHFEYFSRKNLHAHFINLQIFIAILKTPRLAILFNLSDKISQILGPRKKSFQLHDIPNSVSELCLRLHWCSFFLSNSSVIIGAELCIKIARSWRFLLCTETEPFFFSSV